MTTRQLILVGGPNGAGKTTFSMKELALKGGVYLGADAIAAKISPENPASAAIESGRVFLERFDQLIQTEQRLIVESTLAGKSLGQMISRAKLLGFQVQIKFILSIPVIRASFASTNEWLPEGMMFPPMMCIDALHEAL